MAHSRFIDSRWLFLIKLIVFSNYQIVLFRSHVLANEAPVFDIAQYLGCHVNSSYSFLRKIYYGKYCYVKMK